MWGVYIKNDDLRETVVAKTFVNKQDAVWSNDNEFGGKGKVVRVAVYR